VAGLDDAGFTGWVGGLLTNWGRLAAELLLSPGSPYSLAAIAICTALAAFATLSGRRRKRSVPFKVLLRAIFPRRIVRSRSGRADLAFTFFNIFIWAALFGWAVFSASEIGRLVQQGLSSLLGAPSPAPLPGFLCAALMTGALYVAYEFGYWLDHYLAHKIPLLWHFHKVHHSAESLSPITVFRVHPVDTLVYYNILALVMGGTQGLVGFALGYAHGGLALGGTNILLLATGILLVQLQHSHLWISFSGRLGQILLSPPTIRSTIRPTLHIMTAISGAASLSSTGCSGRSTFLPGSASSFASGCRSFVTIPTRCKAASSGRSWTRPRR
jgi:hypothetical protein